MRRSQVPCSREERKKLEDWYYCVSHGISVDMDNSNVHIYCAKDIYVFLSNFLLLFENEFHLNAPSSFVKKKNKKQIGIKLVQFHVSALECKRFTLYFSIYLFRKFLLKQCTSF